MVGQLNLEPGLGYLSWSRLRTYSNCGESYRLSYVDEIPSSPHGAAIAGKAMHQAIAEAEVTESWADPSDVSMQLSFLEHFTQDVEEAGGPEACRWGGRKDREGRPAEDYLWWINFASSLFCRRYAEVRRLDEAAGWSVLEGGIEMEVGITYQGRHIVGYVDAVMVSPDGEPVVRDWKTGRMLEPYQLGVYAWLLGASGRKLTIETGQLGVLRATGGDCLKVYDVAPWAAIVPRMLDDLIRGVDAQVFPLRPSPFCMSCGVREHCSYGVTLEG